MQLGILDDLTEKILGRKGEVSEGVQGFHDFDFAPGPLLGFAHFNWLGQIFRGKHFWNSQGYPQSN